MVRNAPAILEVAAVTSLGHSWDETWRALRAGRRAVNSSPIRPFPRDPDVPVSAVPGLSREMKEDGRGTSTRLLHMALAQLKPSAGGTVGVYGGSNHSEAELPTIWASGSEAFGERDVFVRDSVPASLGARYRAWTYSACASSLHALNLAAMDLEDGECDEAIVVGCDALSSIGVAGFWRCGATTRGECAPFHPDRDGILVGEGAVAMRLSTRAPTGSVRLLGLGMSCDAGHPTDPAANGEWLEAAIRSALERARIRPSDVGAIVAHGTGTPKSDSAEIAAYSRIFGPHILLTSAKGSVGHMMGAAGLLNVAVARQALLQGWLPPTYSRGSSLAPAALVAGSERRLDADAKILAVASGFGGNNVACLVGIP